jgi:CDP-diacylglycerol--serine O-phosphatidyltransferase
VFLVLLAAFLDFFDGFFARLLKVDGEIGKQLDSLADNVTFGVVPALMAFVMARDAEPSFLAYFTLFIAVASAYRLARFNVETGSEGYFSGLPTPANALLWISFFLLFYINPEEENTNLVSGVSNVLRQPLVVVGLALFSSFLLVSRLRLMALKFKPGHAVHNRLRIILILILAIAALLLYLLTKNAWVAVPFLLLLYLIFSLITQSLSKNEVQG